MINNNVYTDSNYGFEDNLYFLNYFSEYDNDSSISALPFRFEETNSTLLLRIEQEFDINRVIGHGNELDKLCKLKQYASEIASFDGKFLRNREFEYLNCIDIINAAKNKGYSLNCRYKSFIVTQMAPLAN